MNRFLSLLFFFVCFRAIAQDNSVPKMFSTTFPVPPYGDERWGLIRNPLGGIYAEGRPYSQSTYAIGRIQIMGPFADLMTTIEGTIFRKNAGVSETIKFTIVGYLWTPNNVWDALHVTFHRSQPDLQNLPVTGGHTIVNGTVYPTIQIGDDNTNWGKYLGVVIDKVYATNANWGEGLLEGWQVSKTTGNPSGTLHTSTVFNINPDSYLKIASNSNNPTNSNFAIGTSGGRNFIQSHNSLPLDINPLGNSVTINGIKIDPGSYFSKAATFIGNGTPGNSGIHANDYRGNKSTFAYVNGSGTIFNGALLSFGGFDGGGYDTQINGSYGGDQIAFRSRNGDVQTWSPWREMYHDGNINKLKTDLGLGVLASQNDVYNLKSNHAYPANDITDYTTAAELATGSLTTVAMHDNHGLFGSYATTLTMSGYDKYGATQLSANYNATTPGLAMRNFNQALNGWTPWERIVTSSMLGSAAYEHSGKFALAEPNSSGVITVGGDFDKYYPVVWSDEGWDRHSESELEIGRSDVHENGTARGSLIAKFNYHSTRWGNGSSFINAVIKSHINNTIAGWKDATTNNGNKEIIIWLRGGTTYHFKSKYSTSYKIYDGTQNALPFQEQGGPAHSYKTSIDSYVNTNGISNDGTAYFNGGGTNFFAGNLGIGTSAPENSEGWDKVLDVYGNGHSKILTSTSHVQTGIWSHNNGYFGSTTGGMAGTYSNHPFSIITNKTVKMTVKSNGHVGIGVSDPTERLTVDGNILTKGIKVNPESVPDYVFKPEYKLRPLEEVERFVKANSHLPEVPSESEVKKNGLELGEMSTTLLKKVEELTLYLIEIKKENENLKQRLEKLERNK